MSINRQIYNLVSELGIPEWGIAEAVPLPQERERLETFLRAGRQAGMAYLERNREMRCDPTLLVPGTRSVWCFLIPYAPRPETPDPGGRIAAFARGDDYHPLIRSRLRKLLQHLQDIRPGTCGRAFTDSAPILEKTWAVRCGLGFIGRNGLLIHPRLGSRVLIGTLLTDIAVDELPETDENGIKRVFRSVETASAEAGIRCGKCRRCLDSCPAGALTAPGRLDARRCLSYRTIEAPGLNPESAETRPLAGWLFGCDACQDICPWNTRSNNASGLAWPEFSRLNPLLARMTPERWRQLSVSEFRNLFCGSPLLRGGLPVLQESTDQKEEDKRQTDTIN